MYWVVFILFVFISICNGAIQFQFNTGVGANNHYYVLVQGSTNYTYSQASQYCSTYNGTEYYLSTISSPYELNYIYSISSSWSDAWVSGVMTSNQGLGFSNFTYTSGPEINDAIWDPNQDVQYSFIRWPATYPEFPAYDTNLVLTEISGQLYYKNVAPTTLLTSFVCEKDYRALPVIQAGQTIPSTGGKITISKLNVGTIITTLTGTNIEDSSVVQCSNFEYPTTTSATCTLPPGLGPYFFVMTDTNSNTFPGIYYQYTPAHIKYVYPSLTSAAPIAIIGTNFGSAMNMIQVSISQAMISCIVTSLTKTFEGYDQIQCSVSGAPLIQFLPIRVKVKGIEVVSYRAPLYYSKTKTFYSIYKQSSSLAFINTYLFSQVFNDMVPFVTVFPEQSELISSLVSFSTLSIISFYQPVGIYNSNTNLYQVTKGPYTGNEIGFNNMFNNVANTSNPIILTMSATKSTVLNSDSDSYSYIIEYPKNPPLFSESTIFENIPYQGKVITTNIVNYGTISSYLEIVCNDCPITPTVSRALTGSNPSEIQIIIPPGYGGPVVYRLLVDGMVSQNTQTYVYAFPNITNIQPDTTPTTGGTVTIFGTNFITNEIATVNVPGCVTSSVTVLSTNMIQFNIDQGTGIISSLLSHVNKVMTFNMKFTPPTISSMSMSSEFPYGNLQITGNNFGFNTSLMSIRSTDIVENTTCEITSSTNTYIECTLSDTAISTYFAVMVSSQQTGFSGVNLFPVIQSVSKVPISANNEVTISGKFWSTKSYSGLIIPMPLIFPSFNGVEGVPLNGCRILPRPKIFIYAFQIVCSFVPFVGTSAFQLSFTYQTKAYLLYSNYQAPTIDYATPVEYNVGGNITIGGSNFYSVITSISIGNRPCMSTFYLDSETLICNFDGLLAISDRSEGAAVSVVFGDLSFQRNVFFYTLSYQCPGTPECSGNGICTRSTGLCKCNEGYDTFNCSVKIQNDPTKPVILPNGTISIDTNTPTSSEDSNSSTGDVPKPSFSFQVGISHIREKSFNNTIINTLSLSTDIHWDEVTAHDDKNTVYYRGSFPGKSPLILEIETTYYQEASNYLFAGENFAISKNSMKMLLHLSNYTFQSTTNSLEVIYKSKTDKSVEYDCGSTETTPTYSNDQEQQEGIDWFQINAGDAIFKACFSKRMIVDNRFRTSKIIVLPDSDPLNAELQQNENEFGILTSLVSPWFETDVYLDPNFSVLTTVDFSEKNGKSGDACNLVSDNDKFPTWKIITIVVVCGVIFIALSIVGVFMLYKNSLTLRIKTQKIIKLIKS